MGFLGCKKGLENMVVRNYITVFFYNDEKCLILFLYILHTKVIF
mgnify:CR=1 FL=1